MHLAWDHVIIKRPGKGTTMERSGKADPIAGRPNPILSRCCAVLVCQRALREVGAAQSTDHNLQQVVGMS